MEVRYENNIEHVLQKFIWSKQFTAKQGSF